MCMILSMSIVSLYYYYKISEDDLKLKNEYTRWANLRFKDELQYLGNKFYNSNTNGIFYGTKITPENFNESMSKYNYEIYANREYFDRFQKIECVVDYELGYIGTAYYLYGTEKIDKDFNIRHTFDSYCAWYKMSDIYKLNELRKSASIYDFDTNIGFYQENLTYRVLTNELLRSKNTFSEISITMFFLLILIFNIAVILLIRERRYEIRIMYVTGWKKKNIIQSIFMVTHNQQIAKKCKNIYKISDSRLCSM